MNTYVFAAQRAIDTDGLDYGYRRSEHGPESEYYSSQKSRKKSR